MTNDPVGLLAPFGFLFAAAGSVPLAVVALVLTRRGWRFSRALRYAGLAVAVLVIALAVGVSTITPAAGVAVVVTAALLGSTLWVVPLLIARWVLARRGTDPERALRNATVGLPVALLASLVIAFGVTPEEGVLIDFTRYNITFLHRHRSRRRVDGARRRRAPRTGGARGRRRARLAVSPGRRHSAGRGLSAVSAFQHV